MHIHLLPFIILKLKWLLLEQALPSVLQKDLSDLQCPEIWGGVVQMVIEFTAK